MVLIRVFWCCVYVAWRLKRHVFLCQLFNELLYDYMCLFS